MAIKSDKSAPVILVITAFGSLEVVTKAIAGKAFDYLVKPLDLKRAGEVAELGI